MPPALQLALLIAVLLPASKFAASVCSRFNIPAILGELLVGILLGPGVFDLLHMRLFHGGQATQALLLLAQIGGLVLMFIAGLETDIDRMREASFTAFLVALYGVVWPFFLGAAAAHMLGLPWRSALFLGGALTATSVSISARTLMDAGKMITTEATIILGAAVIDDVMGLFVLAFLAASANAGAEAFGVAPWVSNWLQHHSAVAARHTLLVQMPVLAVCVTAYFLIGYGVGRKWLDPLILWLRKLTADESVPACVLGLVLIYAISAEWLGSVAGITGAYLFGYIFAESNLKEDIERSFYAIGHSFLIPLFFISIGLDSDFRALHGHWLLLAVIFIIAIISKVVGCGMGALVRGMGAVRSLRIGCGMISRGEVGLIVTAMGASTGIFKPSEVAVMVAVVLLTTLLTPLLLRATFRLHCDADYEPAPLAEKEAEAMAAAAATVPDSMAAEEVFAETTQIG